MQRLSVFVDQVLVGTLHNTRPLSFSYSPEVISGEVEPPFSSIIPVVPGMIDDEAVYAFFENLLPEGDERESLIQQHQVTSVFALLERVGADTAGSVVILPELQTPGKNEYLAMTWEQVSNLANDDVLTSVPIEYIASESNASLSGAQHKILLLVKDDQPFLPIAGSISTHILKPDIVRPGLKIFGSAYNEAVIMKLAQACDLPVADTSYRIEANACLVARYDRYRDVNYKLQRHYQADLCQLLGVTSGLKYEKDGGPSFKECYELVKKKSAVAAHDCHQLLKWLFFNLLIGNNDSHAKNLSMIEKDGRLKLAPFYDLMCTRIYSGLSKNFAFKIGNHYAPGEVTRDDIFMLAESVKVNPRIAIKILVDMASRIEKVMPEIMNQKLAKISKGSAEEIVQERIFNDVKSYSSKLIKRISSE